MGEDWIECCFDDLLKYEQPTKYIVKSTDYSDNYKTPVLTAGKSFIKGYTNEEEGVFDNLPTIIFDDFTTASQFVNFPFKVKSSAMKILVPTSNLVNLKFAYNYMQVCKIRSDTHKRYWISVYSKKNLNLPPLPIQRAIVAKTDELFSGLERGISDLKKALELIKVYKQSVLKVAFEGGFSNKEFDYVKINSICEVVRGGSPRPAGSKKFYNGSIPFMKVKDISRNNGIYITQVEHSIKEAGLKKTRLVNPKTLLLTNSGATLGIPAITTIPTTFNDGIAAFLDLDDNLVYHYYYWCSKTIYLQNLNQGAAQPNLNTSMIGNMKIPIYHEKSEHKKIVQEIESRLSVGAKMEEVILESLEKANALRLSILKKAFEGNLLSKEEIEQCKKEHDYEPASILLEKIKAEKKKK